MLVKSGDRHLTSSFPVIWFLSVRLYKTHWKHDSFLLPFSPLPSSPFLSRFPLSSSSPGLKQGPRCWALSPDSFQVGGLTFQSLLSPPLPLCLVVCGSSFWDKLLLILERSYQINEILHLCGVLLGILLTLLEIISLLFTDWNFEDQKIKILRLGVVAHVFNPRAWEVETRESQSSMPAWST